MDVLLTLLPGGTKKDISSIAGYFGMKRPVDGYKSTGLPLIDVIRDRAFERGINMPELDRLCGSRGYFARAGWYDGSVNYDAIARAVEALGGKLYVEWED
jgi:hypothetical protein